ncbi:MAG: hypothetical protein H6816_02635 [Phycisphaerales bacterium]|nr:hypothetical protein [Phycisphaerales bacterium]
MTLMLEPSAGADRAVQRAGEIERELIFPMTLVAASNHFRSRGNDCRPGMLEVLVRNKVVRPADPDVWSPADVDAADHFRDNAGHPPSFETTIRPSAGVLPSCQVRAMRSR